MRRCVCLVLFLTYMLLLSCSLNTRTTAVPMIAPEKRRMVIRVPFMQNPDSEQLSRIFHTSFTEQKRKMLNDNDADFFYSF